jgi:hypothetical protein
MADQLHITADMARKLLSYDPNTGKLIWRHRTPDMFGSGQLSSDRRCKIWNSCWSGFEINSKDNKGYLRCALNRKTVLAHRVIWLIVYGEWPPCDIDHVNGIRDDNRLANLRLATDAENQQNVGAPVHNTSGLIGAHWFARQKSGAVRSGRPVDQYISVTSKQRRMHTRRTRQPRLDCTLSSLPRGTLNACHFAAIITSPKKI